MFLILFQIFKIISNISLKKHETLTTIPPIHIYINRINNRLVFKIKDGYKLELQTPETMKLFGSTKQLIDKKNGEQVLSLEVVEVVLVQYNVVDNQYQSKSEILCIFIPNESYAYLSNVKPSNLVSLKIYNTEFDEIFVKLDGNSRNVEEIIIALQTRDEILIELREVL